MASYNNPQPFVPMVPEFQPDLNAYQQLLSMKEAQYQSGYQKVAGLYGSLYNSPMIREDNKEVRSKYFDKIEADIKKLAGYDLSLEQNITSAQKIFKPLSDDPFIMKDIAFTKQVQSELGRAESLRNSIPKEGEPKFWEGGIRALTYQVNDFASAPREKSLNMQAPRYTPFVNVAEKAMKWAKDMGLSMKTVSKEGGFIITTKNGQPMEAGLRDTFLSVFGGDAAVQEMYKTQAYLTRKDAIAATLNQYDSPELAEAAYLDMSLAAMDMDAKEVLAQTQPKLDAIAAKKSLAEKTMQSYTYDPELDKDIADLYEQLHMDEQAVGATKSNAEAILQHVNTSGMGNLDLDVKRLRVDGASANYLMLNDLSHAAAAYSQLTMEQDVQAEPYSLAAYNHSNTMSEIQARAETDLFLEYAKYGIDAHAPDAFDQMKAMRLMISGGGSGKVTAPGYPGTPAAGQGVQGGGFTTTTGSPGSNLHPSMTIETGGLGNSTDAERYKVYDENYKKIETTKASAIAAANDLTNSWMSTLVSTWENGSTPEQRTVAMGEIRKIVGEEQFEKMSRQLGGDANVVGELKRLHMDKGVESFFYNEDEGSTGAIFKRAQESLSNSSKAYANADASMRSSGKILEVPTQKLMEYQQKTQQAKRAYNDWKSFDEFAKRQNTSVGRYIQGKVEGVPANRVNSFIEDGRVVDKPDFVAREVKAVEAVLQPLENEMRKWGYAFDTARPDEIPALKNKFDKWRQGAVQSISTAANDMGTDPLREYQMPASYGVGVPNYQRNEYEGARFNVMQLLQSGYPTNMPKQAVDVASGPDELRQIPRFEGDMPVQASTVGKLREYTKYLAGQSASDTYDKINSKFYEVYNGNFQSPDGSGAVARQWNGSPLLGDQSGGGTAAIRTFSVDQANYTDPDFMAIHEVMTNAQGIQGKYQFGSVKTIGQDGIEDDDTARSLWEKAGSVFRDPGLAKDDELGRARGKLEMSGITAGDPYTVGFTFRADPAFILANKGTKTKPGLFTPKEEELLMEGITFTADKRDAANLALVRQLETDPEDARLGMSDQMNPLVLDQPDGGKVSVYKGARGFVVEGYSLDVTPSGEIIKIPLTSFTRPFTTTGLVQGIESSLMENAVRVRSLRMNQKEVQNARN
jgi:hypothetical protein